MFSQAGYGLLHRAKIEISHLSCDWRFSTNPVEDIEPNVGCVWHLTPSSSIQDWWRTVNEMSNFMSTGRWEISFFALCLLLKEGHIQYMCSSLVPRPHPFGRGLGTRLHVQWPMCRDVVCWLFNRICKRYAHANVLPKNIMHTNPCKCWQYLTGMRYRGNKVGGCDCLAPPTSLSGPYTWIPIGPNETTVTLFWQALRDEKADVNSPCSRLLRVLHFCEG